MKPGKAEFFASPPKHNIKKSRVRFLIMFIAKETAMVRQYQRSHSCHRNVMHIKYSFMSLDLILFHCLLNHTLKANDNS